MHRAATHFWQLLRLMSSSCWQRCSSARWWSSIPTANSRSTARRDASAVELLPRCRIDGPGFWLPRRLRRVHRHGDCSSWRHSCRGDEYAEVMVQKLKRCTLSHVPAMQNPTRLCNPLTLQTSASPARSCSVKNWKTLRRGTWWSGTAVMLYTVETADSTYSIGGQSMAGSLPSAIKHVIARGSETELSWRCIAH